MASPWGLGGVLGLTSLPSPYRVVWGRVSLLVPSWTGRGSASSLISSPAHPAVCLAVWHNHHMRTVTNYFIVNLSLADVLVTAICLPASLLVDITESWLFGHALCKVIPYLQVSSA